MSQPQNVKIILTEDGSHSLQLLGLEETYHSTHGAIQESNHVFIDTGLKYWLGQNKQAIIIKVLEFGFGTGLNTLLSASNPPKNISIAYDTIDKYPLSKKITNQLNYGCVLNEVSLFDEIHETPWGEKIEILPSFQLNKIQQDFRHFRSRDRYDIIYFDAFAPSKQPELWTKEILENCYNLLNEGGVFVTYSAKGQLKRDLRAIGFTVESLPGPPGKFEITRAIKLSLA